MPKHIPHNGEKVLCLSKIVESWSKSLEFHNRLKMASVFASGILHFDSRRNSVANHIFGSKIRFGPI